MSATHAPYGLWNSPLTPRSVSLGQRLGDALWDSDGETLVWLEGRGDRGVLVALKLDGGAPRDLTDEHPVRARVGYGGGDFCVAHGAAFFVSNGRLFRQSLASGPARAISPPFGQAASPVVSPCGKFVLYVFSHERRDGLAVVDAHGNQWPKKVAEGRDFFMQPRLSPDGSHAAWVCWDHPNMPWDGAELMLANVRSSGGTLPDFEAQTLIDGGADIAVTQPEFSPDGRYLSYLSDQSGWFELFVYDLKTQSRRKLIDAQNAQLGGPAWAQGQRFYGWSHDSKSIVFTRNERGVSTLRLLDIESANTRAIDLGENYTDFQQPALNPRKPLLAALVSSGVRPPRIVVASLDQNAQRLAPQVLKRSTGENIEPAALIEPRAVSWMDDAGNEIHGLLYAAKREGLGGLPPAIVRVHGGPTAQARAAYSAEIQFLATRGYALLDLNYRGSTGFGRHYMNALRGNWGVCDVADAVSAAKFLSASGEADARRLVVMGGSAGGFTVLQTLVDHPGLFKAGVCLYGVSNQFALALETHKFEERYLDSLLGPLPECSAIYCARSPALHAGKIVDPLVIFQGEIDEVVPRNQSDAIVESLKSRGIPHEYHIYPGEGHGWRKIETIEAYVTALEKFLKRHVLFA